MRSSTTTRKRSDKLTRRFYYIELYIQNMIIVLLFLKPLKRDVKTEKSMQTLHKIILNEQSFKRESEKNHHNLLDKKKLGALEILDFDRD